MLDLHLQTKKLISLSEDDADLTFLKSIRSAEINIITKKIFGAVEYTDCTSAEGWEPPTHNERPGYDTKQSDGEVPVMLELWAMQSTRLLPSFPGPLWPGMVTPDRALSMG